MKVAVILTGFLRTYSQAFPLLRESILDQYDVDLYLATWDKQENNLPTCRNFDNIYKEYQVKNIIVENLYKYNENKQIIQKIIRSGDVFDVNQRAKHHGEYWANRLKDQWYLVQKCFSSVQETGNYDIILRLRYDIFLHNIVLNKRRGITIPQDIGGWTFTDHMAYGDPDSMKKYCFLHDNIYKLYKLYNLDITHATEMPKFYLESYLDPVSTTIDTSIKYSIRK
jgi:hypothetical protein